MAPKELMLAKGVSSVDMTWINGPSGRGPILGYYIEAKKRGKSWVARVFETFFFWFEVYTNF